MKIEEFFQQYPNVAVAFSGGVDSSCLLYLAKKYAEKVCAYYVNAEFQPKFELEDATRLADSLGVEMKVQNVSVLSVQNVRENPKNRCYYCKKAIFSTIIRMAESDGFSVLLDGTNASDDITDRPGMKALQELSVLSPLRECGITKEQVRKLSKEAGLFTWDKPAYACLATRIPAGEEITIEKLSRTELAEDFLFSLGFTDFRVRLEEGKAKIQLPETQWSLLLKYRKEVFEKLKTWYQGVVLDLEVRE